MGIVRRIKDYLTRDDVKGDSLKNANRVLFDEYIKGFNLSAYDSPEMTSAVNEWNDVYQNSRTQLMKTVCKEAAKLTLTDFAIEITLEKSKEELAADKAREKSAMENTASQQQLDISSEEAELSGDEGSQTISSTCKAIVNNNNNMELQEIEDPRMETISLLAGTAKKLVRNLTRGFELGLALGSLCLKSTPDGIQLISPTNFIPVEFNSDGDLRECIFIDRVFSGRYIFTRLEYHHFTNEGYVVDSRCYRSSNQFDIGQQCSLKDVKQWENIDAHAVLDGVTEPLFGYFRVPGCNNIDENSVSGISLCSSALAHLKKFEDIYEEFSMDMELSRKAVFVNDATLLSQSNMKQVGGNTYKKNPIPNLIVGMGTGVDQIHEYTPQSNVEHYRTAMQMVLDMIATSCGFTAGYFSLDKDLDPVTATQIESQDAVTVNTVKDIRDALQSAVDAALEGYYQLLQYYEKAPAAGYSVSYYALDLSATPITDRNHTKELVSEGLYPLADYLNEYEGFSEDDAQKIADKKYYFELMEKGYYPLYLYLLNYEGKSIEEARMICELTGAKVPADVKTEVDSDADELEEMGTDSDTEEGLSEGEVEAEEVPEEIGS